MRAVASWPGLGVQIAMDDLAPAIRRCLLQSFLRQDKIDQAFIAILARVSARSSVRSSRSARANLPVVAEGVETDEQLRFLAAEGCSEFQGYLVGRPKPIDEYAHAVGRAQADRPRSKSLAAAG
jgi:EAL domain-containing protein (putative c-di-GMP-specific phosphodiesterase class I)